jgi:hypothetical protein
MSTGLPPPYYSLIPAESALDGGPPMCLPGALLMEDRSSLDTFPSPAFWWEAGLLSVRASRRERRPTGAPREEGGGGDNDPEQKTTPKDEKPAIGGGPRQAFLKRLPRSKPSRAVLYRPIYKIHPPGRQGPDVKVRRLPPRRRPGLPRDGYYVPRFFFTHNRWRDPARASFSAPLRLGSVSSDGSLSRHAAGGLSGQIWAGPRAQRPKRPLRGPGPRQKPRRPPPEGPGL